jgi:hypothetical protein
MKPQINNSQHVRARFFLNGENVYDKVVSHAEYESLKEKFNRQYKNSIGRYYWAEPVKEIIKD